MPRVHVKVVLTCGIIAQKTGVEFLLTNARTRPIFFFLTIVFKSALKVRLLPENVLLRERLDHMGCNVKQGATHHFIGMDEHGVFDVIFKNQLLAILET